MAKETDGKFILTCLGPMMLALAYLMEERIGKSTVSTELRNLSDEAKERAGR